MYEMAGGYRVVSLVWVRFRVDSIDAASYSLAQLAPMYP
jgi:hypothetical protein